MKLPAQSKYPKQLYVGGESYRLIFVKGLECCGITDSVARTVKIKAGLSPRETFATFVHEVAHCIEFEYNIAMKHKAVYKFERGLLAFFLDNFVLVKP